MSGNSPEDITIRPARPDEAGELTELSMRSKQSNGYDDAFMDACRQELTVTEQWFHDGEIWVAEADDVCGFAGLDFDYATHTGEVHSFFIDPGWQRKGVGRLLWHKLLERATASKTQSLHLAADPAAVPFYQTLGFKIMGKIASGSIEGRYLPKMAIELPSRNRVVQSINLTGDCQCVDVFERSGGTFGFEEYRRDPEDGRGWFAIGFHSDQTFESAADALAEAKRQVPWLTSIIEGR